MAAGRVLGVCAMCAIGLLACGPRPDRPGPIPDGGPDAPRPRDASFPDAGPDAGPPGDPVLPAQSWQVTLMVSDVTGSALVDASILIDARPAWGSVAAVIGGNGRGNNVVLDIVEPGTLVSRTPIDLGVRIPTPECRSSFVRLSRASLSFRDTDGDGVLETLDGVSGEVESIDALGNVIGTGFLFGATITPDTTGPTLVAEPARPLGNVGTLQLFASEPIDPGVVPYLELSGRRFALRETPGASAPSHWSIALSSLPIAAGYTLRFEGEVRDLAGNAAVTVPEMIFTVNDLGVLAPDGFETGLSGIAAEEGVRALVGDELPLVGSTSAFATGRTVIVFEPPPSASFVSFVFRLHSDRDETFALSIRILTPEGRLLSASPAATFVTPMGTVAGFAFQSEPAATGLSFPAGHDLLVLEIDPRGSREVECGAGIPRTDDSVPLAITIDSVEIR